MPEPMLDAICLLYSQDSYRRLVVEEGYSRAAYQRLLARQPAQGYDNGGIGASQGLQAR